MTDSKAVEGRLVALHWPEGMAGATVEMDLSLPVAATAEIEDQGGVTQRIKVCVNWDADYLVGKRVRTQTAEIGTTLVPAE
ncbi:MAG: hypothetical protein QGG74_03855 [Phycisphaerales bacterium]|jgi:hypothetical protein|nr:hypothetical protein [Phycisphaerales bacterium]MDP6987160.1 hypothetical protein [Phycisphaerales bacterium]